MCLCVQEDRGESNFLSVSNLHAQTHKKNNENINQETFPVHGIFIKGAKWKAKSNATYQRKELDSVSRIFEMSPTSV